MDQKETTSVRLRKAMDLRNINQTQLVKDTGISKGAISSYISGSYEPKQDNLYKLAITLDVSPTWLMGLDVPMEKGSNDYENYKNLIAAPTFNKKIPLLGTIAAGTPILADENVEMYVDLDKAINADFCLKIKGDSMINANINDGDIVFIKKQSDVDDGDIAAVLIDDEATLKRVYKMAGQVILRAENPKFKAIELNGKENVIILGKAVYSLKKLV